MQWSIDCVCNCVFFHRKSVISSMFLILILASSSSAFASEATTVRIPMDFSAGRPTVQVTIQGKGPYSFIFDTGASEGVIDSELADELGLEVVQTSEISDGITTEAAEDVRAESILLGSSKFENVVLTKFSLQGKFRSHFLGVIGMSIFADNLLTIDYPGNQILIKNGALSRTSSGTIPYRPTDGLFEVDIQINGVNVPVHLDSGSSEGFTLPKQIADRMQFSSEPIQTGEARTVTGVFPVWTARLEGLIYFAGLQFSNPKIGIVSGFSKGQIGQNILKNLKVTLDQKNQLIHVEPVIPPTGTWIMPFPRFTCGSGLRSSGNKGPV